MIKDYVYLGFQISKKYFYKVQSLKSNTVFKIQNNNVINKYQNWYPYFLHLRMICYLKGRFVLKRKIWLIFSFSFFLRNVFVTTKLQKLSFISNILLISWLYYLVQNFISLGHISGIFSPLNKCDPLLFSRPNIKYMHYWQHIYPIIQKHTNT